MENVLKLEAENIEAFQEPTYMGTQEDPDVLSRFANDITKIAASNHVKLKLDCSVKDEGSQICYTASNSFDVLFDVKGYVELPAISVAKTLRSRVEICYKHNVGNIIFSEAECKVDGDHYGYLDTHVLNIYGQSYLSHDERKENKECIGSVPQLEEWSKDLPRWELEVLQPYHFTRNKVVALPILKSKVSITFTYTMKLSLTDLLKMRVYNEKTQTYKYIPVNLDYLDIKKEKIKIPELWGRYANITESERNWRKEIDEKTRKPRTQTVYIEDWETAGSKNPVPLGARDVISLSTTAPTKSVFWMASRVDSEPCNYTTNKDSVYLGYNPCFSGAIKYGASKRTEEMSHRHFDRSEFRDFGLTVPDERGYNLWTLGYELNKVQLAEPATVMKKISGTLIVKLGNTDPYFTKKEKEETYDENGDVIPKEILETASNSETETYNIIVKSVVIRKMEIYWDDSSNCLKYKIISGDEHVKK